MHRDLLWPQCFNTGDPMIKWMFLFLFASNSILFAESSSSPFQVPRGAKLVADVHLLATNSADKSKVEAGSDVLLAARITNKGDRANTPGEVYIQFVRSGILGRQVLFQTEKKQLPVIYPEQTASVTFNTIHKWPKPEDFLNEGWSHSEYEVIGIYNGRAEILGKAKVEISNF